MKKKNKGLIILALLLCITIGYAALTTTLNITGNSEIKNAKWDIHFANLKIDGTSVEASTPANIDENKTTVNYVVNLVRPGDSYSFSVDAINEGTIDGMISTVSNNGLTPEQQKYVEYSVTYANGKELKSKDGLKAGTKRNIKVKVKYKDDINPEDLPKNTETLTLTFSIEYVQADENEMTKLSLIKLPEGKTKDTLTVGDEICIYGDTTECFNFIKYDENEDLLMLAKWNLKVGHIYDSNGGKIGEYTDGDTEYGLQSSEARGYVSEQTRYGIVPFSATNYWYDGSILKSKYGSSYPADLYDTDYKTAPDFSARGFYTEGYSVAYYVEKYKKILTNYGVTIKNTRLLTYSEVTDSSIGCSQSKWACPTTGFITNTTFWLESAYNSYMVWYVGSDGSFSASSHDYGGGCGVRPVIIISKADI